MITDGEDQGTQPIEAAEEAAKNGIKISIFGIGSADGAPVPDGSGGFIKDENGNIVLSKFVESSLAKLAEITGGMYVPSVAGDLDWEKLYMGAIASTQDEFSEEETRQRVWHERYQWFVLAGFVTLFVECMFARRFSA